MQWQWLPIAVGILGGVLLAANRLLTPEIAPSQARSDAVGVIISAVLVLTGLLWQQFQPTPPDAVKLVGEEGFELDETLPEAVQTELAWSSYLLLTNTVTKSIVVWYDGKVRLRRGILGKNPQLTPGPIVDRVLSKQKAVYLVKLELYPGRIEFDYLPENTQGVICQPIGDRGAMILGANVPRSYTQKDENWIAGIAEKLAQTWQGYS